MKRPALNIYVVGNANCNGLRLMNCYLLSHVVTVAVIDIALGDGTYRVRGWSSVYGGSFVPVSLAKVEYEAQVGILVFGGDWGLKLEKSHQVYGRPIIWIRNENDIPESIRKRWQPS